MNIPFEPIKKRSTRGMITKIIFSVTSVTMFMLQVSQLTVLYGNLADRITHDLFINSSYLLQVFDYGWIFAYIIGGLILLGPMNYYMGLCGIPANYDLIISVLGIYFVASIIIGITMKNYTPIGGFLLGFLTIAFFNIIVYTIATYGSTLLSRYGIGEEIGGIIQVIISSFLNGVYNQSIGVLLINGILINGTIMGVFGAFWTAVLMPSRKSMLPEPIKVKCPSGGKTCIIPASSIQSITAHPSYIFKKG